MSLPKINYPLFDVVIPSSQKKIKMRPFLVKEEKILLMAQSSDDSRDTVLAIKQVVNNCIVDDVDVDKLTTFDLEYMFVKLRARSINNLIDVVYNDPEDEQQYKIQINLDNVEIKTDPKHKNVVEINDDYGLMLRYPKTDMLQQVEKATSEVDLYFEVIKYCIDKVYDANDVYEVKDYSDEELQDFVSSLDVNTFKQIQLFLETMPKLHYEASYTNSLGTERKVVLQNLNDFFMLG
jgi:T4 bacteriophage base plate protein